MTLKEFLTKYDLMQKDFAKKLKVSEASVTYYCKGQKIPSPSVMNRIHQMTNGKVTANDFYSLDNNSIKKSK